MDSRKDIQKVLVVVPTYNESANIDEMISRVRSIDLSPEVLVVDDRSPDGTAELARQIAKRDEKVHVIERDGKRSFSRSYLDGYKYALDYSYDAVVCMDADLSHHPEDVPKLVDGLKENDFVIGSRYLESNASVEDWPITRLVLSKCSSMYVRLILGLPVTDPMGGFKAIKTSELAKLNFDDIFSRGYAFQTEVLYRLYKKGCRVCEVGIVFTDRKAGESKMDLKRIFEAMIMPFKLRSKVRT